VTKADFETAEKAVEFIREYLGAKDESQMNDYEHNLYVALKQKSVTSRTLGITCSAIPFYLREIGKMEERKKMAARPPSQHFGQVGDKVTFKATLLSVFPNESDFGVSYRTLMLTPEGNVVVWWASNDMTTEDPEVAARDGLLCKGVESTISGRIKKHDTYRPRDPKPGMPAETKQTVVTRCTVWTAEGLRLEAEKAAKKAAREAKKAEKAAKEAAKASKPQE
jgi:hypothetical protein